jgi:hypothetical protein
MGIAAARDREDTNASCTRHSVTDWRRIANGTTYSSRASQRGQRCGLHARCLHQGQSGSLTLLLHMADAVLFTSYSLRRSMPSLARDRGDAAYRHWPWVAIRYMETADAPKDGTELQPPPGVWYAPARAELQPGAGMSTNASCTRHWRHPAYAEPAPGDALTAPIGEIAAPMDAPPTPIDEIADTTNAYRTTSARSPTTTGSLAPAVDRHRQAQ